MDDLKTGTAKYMSLYPEASTDGALRLGNIIPDFSCETTQGDWESFHEWKKGKVCRYSFRILYCFITMLISLTQYVQINFLHCSGQFYLVTPLTSLLFVRQKLVDWH